MLFNDFRSDFQSTLEMLKICLTATETALNFQHGFVEFDD